MKRFVNRIDDDDDNDNDDDDNDNSNNNDDVNVNKVMVRDNSNLESGDNAMPARASPRSPSSLADVLVSRDTFI